jgi:enamine deaminase RidA (YjgF/YER057c/UK114 family)
MAEIAKSSVRRVVNPDSLRQPPGWSHAVEAGGWVFGSGAMACDFESGLAPHARLDPRTLYLDTPIGKQGRAILQDMSVILSEAGCDIRSDLIRVWQWIRASYPSDADYRDSRAHWPCFPSGDPYLRALMEMVGDPKRSSTGIGVRRLPVTDAVLSVDFIAVKDGAAKVVTPAPPDLPQPKIGYSAATRYGDWVFLAGFGATDFKGDWMSAAHMGERGMVAADARVNPYIWLGSEIEAQTDYTLKALARIAEAAGTSLSRCVKADVTITHPDDFLGMDRVWAKHFPSSPPARTVVTGAQLVQRGLRVEIALLLLAGDSKLERRSIDVGDRAAIIGHAPHAIKAGEFLFLSSLLPTDASGGVPDRLRENPGLPFFDQIVRRQSEAIFECASAICEAAGTTLANTCKAQVFFDDLGGMPQMLDAWRAAFPAAPPALSAVEMGGGAPLLAPGAHLQADFIVYAP